MRAIVVKTSTPQGSGSHNPASPVTFTFNRAIDTSVMTQHVTVYDAVSYTLVTPFTLTWVALDYQLGVAAPFESGSDYLINIGRELPSAISGIQMGEEYVLNFRTTITDVGASYPLDPADATRQASMPVFSWLSPSGGTLHQLQVATDTYYSSPTLDTTVATPGGGTLQVAPITLTADRLYYWRVRAVGGAWSENQSFYYGEAVEEAALLPFYIQVIYPNDMTFQSVVTAVTIVCSSTPATPTGTAAHWVTTSVRGSEGVDGSWDGTWSVSGRSLVFTPAVTATAFFVRYDLYLDEVVDTVGNYLDLPVPVGQPVYSVSGLYTPCYVNPMATNWGISPIEAGYYLHLASVEAASIAATSVSTSLLVAYVSTAGRIMRLRDQMAGILPDVGQRSTLGDYTHEVQYSAIDAWIKALDELEIQLQALEGQIVSTRSKTGRRGEDFDPAAVTDWYTPLRREFILEPSPKTVFDASLTWPESND